MRTFWNHDGGRRPRSQHPTRRASFRPRVEALEGRDVPAGTIAVNGGVLILTGTDHADSARVRYDDRGTVLLFDDRLVVTLSQTNSATVGTFNVYRTLLPYQLDARYERVITRLDFTGAGGDDTFANNSELPAQADGGPG